MAKVEITVKTDSDSIADIRSIASDISKIFEGNDGVKFVSAKARRLDVDSREIVLKYYKTGA